MEQIRKGQSIAQPVPSSSLIVKAYSCMYFTVKTARKGLHNLRVLDLILVFSESDQMII